MKVAAVGVGNKQPNDASLGTIKGLLNADDEVVVIEDSGLKESCDADLGFFCGICGTTPLSASGVLPPGMMEEDRYLVRETVPSWPGQSMVVSTPRLGPVILARLAGDCSGLHAVYGEADSLGFGDKYGWYRGRWFIKLPSMEDFARKCLHQHYAIGRDTGDRLALEVLTEKLLRLELGGVTRTGG